MTYKEGRDMKPTDRDNIKASRKRARKADKKQTKAKATAERKAAAASRIATALKAYGAKPGQVIHVRHRDKTETAITVE